MRQPKKKKLRVTNPVVIMAGGKGERLDPFTKILPKPLIPFCDKPIIEVIMNNFYAHGFDNFILTLNYKKDFIKMFFSENRFPFNVKWVEEEDYLGSAGGLGLLRDKIKETFFVCNCDTLLRNNFKDILRWHRKQKSILTIVGCKKEIVIHYGVLKMESGNLKAIDERPVFDMVINTGFYVMEPEIFSLISPGERLDMNLLIERAISKVKVSVYPVSEGWFDLGQWKEYKESLYLLNNNLNI